MASPASKSAVWLLEGLWKARAQSRCQAALVDTVRCGVAGLWGSSHRGRVDSNQGGVFPARPWRLLLTLTLTLLLLWRRLYVYPCRCW